MLILNEKHAAALHLAKSLEQHNSGHGRCQTAREPDQAAAGQTSTGVGAHSAPRRKSMDRCAKLPCTKMLVREKSAEVVRPDDDRKNSLPKRKFQEAYGKQPRREPCSAGENGMLDLDLHECSISHAACRYRLRTARPDYMRIGSDKIRD